MTLSSAVPPCAALLARYINCLTMEHLHPPPPWYPILGVHLCARARIESHGYYINESSIRGSTVTHSQKHQLRKSKS